MSRGIEFEINEPMRASTPIESTDDDDNFATSSYLAAQDGIPNDSQMLGDEEPVQENEGDILEQSQYLADVFNKTHDFATESFLETNLKPAEFLRLTEDNIERHQLRLGSAEQDRIAAMETRLQQLQQQYEAEKTVRLQAQQQLMQHEPSGVDDAQHEEAELVAIEVPSNCSDEALADQFSQVQQQIEESKRSYQFKQALCQKLSDSHNTNLFGPQMTQMRLQQLETESKGLLTDLDNLKIIKASLREELVARTLGKLIVHFEETLNIYSQHIEDATDDVASNKKTIIAGLKECLSIRSTDQEKPLALNQRRLQAFSEKFSSDEVQNIFAQERGKGRRILAVLATVLVLPAFVLAITSRLTNSRVAWNYFSCNSKMMARHVSGELDGTRRLWQPQSQR